jgi:hypothetical protein
MDRRVPSHSGSLCHGEGAVRQRHVLVALPGGAIAAAIGTVDALSEWRAPSATCEQQWTVVSAGLMTSDEALVDGQQVGSCGQLRAGGRVVGHCTHRREARVGEQFGAPA